MIKIFIGLLFLFFNVNIQGLNLMPAFVGYILLFVGLDDGYECPSLSASRTIAVASAVLSGAIWVARLMGYGITLPVGTFLSLLNTYRLVMWAAEQVEDQGWDESRISRFRTSWYALAGATIAATVLGGLNSALGFVWTVATVAADVWYIYVFYTLWKSAAPEEG